ncbi:MAG: sulfatase-like hydrolase/transferase [Myxococcales bacterium]|nr:sulfatase-like hydrolase/transferase [Myxococcales bacterium]
MEDRSQGTGAWTGRAAATGALAGAVAGGVDGALTLARGPWAPAFLIVSCGVLALAGAFVGVGLALAERGVRRWWASGRPTAAWWVGALWGTAVLAGGLVLAGLAVFERETPAARLHAFAWQVGAAAVLAIAVMRAVAWALARRRGWTAAAVAVPVIAGAAVARASAGVIEEVDVRFVWVALAFVAAWIGLRLRWRARARRWVIGATAVAAVGAAVLATRPALRLIAARYSPASERVARALARVGDVDGDGFSPLGGEGDCGPFDAAVHPFAVDVPGDGVDQDCHAGDLDPRVLPPTPRPVAAAPRAGRRPHVVLVSIETLRADHVGFHGHARATTPRLDAWAAGAAVFERAYTPAPVTDRALPAWLGGLYPSMVVEALDYETHVMADERELLSERLRAAGYHTVVVQSFHAFAAHGLAQGVEQLDILDRPATQDARWTTRRAVHRVREHLRDRPADPLFLWVHYYEPHSRYTPPREHALWGEARAVDRYDGEIHYVDEQVGALLDRLDELGVLQDAYVVLAADHGEEFLEHGRTMHAHAVYEESVRVPWAIRGPGLRARRIDAPVTLLDLTPTLLDLLDVPAIPGIDGVSQAAALRGGEVVARPFFIEQFRHGSAELQQLAVVDGEFKMIVDLEHQLWELYDVLADPRERVGLDGGGPEWPRLRGLLLDHRARSQAARWRWEAGR